MLWLEVMHSHPWMLSGQKHSKNQTNIFSLNIIFLDLKRWFLIVLMNNYKNVCI